jgi:hypothetical protein
MGKLAFRESDAQLSSAAFRVFRSTQGNGAYQAARARMVVLEVGTSTPKACGFIAAALHSPRYNSKNYTINVKAPRSIISSEALKEITYPRLEPGDGSDGGILAVLPCDQRLLR